MNSLEFNRLVAECAARHHTPKAEFAHPAVIVPGDPFMTEKLTDPDYVPYCFGTHCGRTRRTAVGFRCLTCGNEMNYDLTHYDGNVNVQYVTSEAELVPPPAPLTRKQWNDNVAAKRQAKKALKGKA
jgi:hypothetical protein